MRRLIVVLLIVLQCGCGGAGVDVSQLAAGDPKEVYTTEDNALETDQIDNEGGNAVNFGITPWDDPEKMRTMHAPLIAYLSEQMGVKVRFIVTQEYQELFNDLKRGIIQIAAFSAGSYADALDAGIEKFSTYVASTQNDGQSYYRGAIIVGKQYKTLQSLKGKEFAFVEKGSSSGYKFPLSIFLQRGINPYHFFSKIYYLGSHANVVEAVVSGKVAAGATWDGYVERHQKQAVGSVRVLLRTELIPYDAIVVSKNKGHPFAIKLQRTLSRITKQTKTQDGRLVLNKEVGFPYSGYVVFSPAFYGAVRQTGRLIKNFTPPAEEKTTP